MSTDTRTLTLDQLDALHDALWRIRRASICASRELCNLDASTGALDAVETLTLFQDIIETQAVRAQEVVS